MRLTFLSFLASFLLSGFTQEPPQPDSTLAEEINCRRNLRVGEAVSILSEHLRSIGDSRLTFAERHKYVERVLDSFIGHGLDYYEYLLNENENVQDSVLRKAVTIEITDLRRGVKRRMPLKVYLRGLADLKYKPVKLITVE